MSQRAEFVGLSLSPYSDRARWALDWCGVEYEYREHLLIFGMPALRWRLGNLTGDVTVPVLFTRPLPLTDSYDIARYADREGTERPNGRAGLFPAENVQAIASFNRLSEEIMDAGRALTALKIANDPAAQSASLPPFIPRFLRGLFRPLASLGVRYLARSFGFDGTTIDAQRELLRERLGRFRERLNAAPPAAGESPRYLLGRFTYADVTMAVSLMFVDPVDEKYKRLPGKARQCWHDEPLAREFKDLLEWRDSIYLAQHPAATLSKPSARRSQS